MSLAGHNRLADLAERIRAANSAMLAASQEAAKRALEAGRLLIDAKAECRHGDWLPFLDKAGIHERQARRLMQLARSGLKSDTVSDLGIKGALEVTSKRTLPKHGDVLMVHTPDPDSQEWGGSAWVWEAAEHPGFYHVVGIGRGFALVEATQKPLTGEHGWAAFQSVD